MQRIEVRHRGELYKVPNPFKPKIVTLTMIIQGEKVRLELIEIIPNALYVNRTKVIRKKIQLKGGEVLSRNDELATSKGYNPRNPNQRHFLSYGTIYEALRGICKADRSYSHEEIPKVLTTHTGARDLWKLIKMFGRFPPSIRRVFSSKANELAAAHYAARNDHKVSARKALTEAAGKTKSPADIDISPLLRQVEKDLETRIHQSEEISSRLEFRYNVLEAYLTMMHERFGEVSDSCLGVMNDRELGDRKADSEFVQSKVKSMRRFAESLDKTFFPRPQRWVVGHISQDLLKAAGKLEATDIEATEQEVRKVYNGIFLVLTRAELEAILAGISFAAAFSGNIPMEVWGDIKAELQEIHEKLSSPDLEKGFKKPVLPDVVWKIQATIEHIENPALEPDDRIKSVVSALKEACEPL